jgi:hypothetical protein
MQNINLEDLDLVCGGTGVPSTPTPITPSGLTGGSSSSACGGSDALLTSLNSIGSSIKDLSHKNNGGMFGGGDSTMLMLGMAMAMRNNNDGPSTVVVNGGYGGGCRGGGGFSFHARW